MGSPRSAVQPLYGFCVATPREQQPTDGVIYVNWARAMGSPYDLVLDLGFRVEDAPPPTFPIRAVMTWEQAKGLRDLLQDAIEQYEQEVGDIRDFGEQVLPARDPDNPDQLLVQDGEEEA